MIVLTRLNGTPLGVNPDLIERIDVTPDTVVTLVDGKKFVVTEPIDAVISQVVAFRACVLAATEAQLRDGAGAGQGPATPAAAVTPRPFRLLSGEGGGVEGEA